MKTNQNRTPHNWTELELSNLSSKNGLVRGPFGGALKKEIFVEHGYKVYEQKNAIHGSINIGKYYINRQKFVELERFSVEPGDFIVSCSGTIGRIFQIPNNAPAGVINQALLKIRLNEKIIIDKYFYYQFIWNKFQSKIIDNAQGGAMQNLVGMDIFKKTKMFIPPLSEQQRIVEVLETWDRYLELLNNKIESKKNIKQALKQQLLTGKKRFRQYTYKWERVKFGGLFDERDETKVNTLPLLSITATHGVIPQSQSKKKDTSNNDKSKYKRIYPGDIGYNTMRMWQGRSALSEIEGLVSPAYTILKPKKNVHSKYFSYLFKLPRVVYLFFQKSQGLVNDTLNCRYKDFSIVKYLVPKIEEQIDIANILSAADAEISVLINKKAIIERQKKYLLNNLITGQIRLPEFRD
jgi:type I restriction enzyme, S subunit